MNSIPSSLRHFIWCLFKPYRWKLLGYIFPMIYLSMEVSLKPYILKILINQVLTYSEDLSQIIKKEFWIALSIPLLTVLFIAARRTKELFDRAIVPSLSSNIVNIMVSIVHQHAYRFFQENFSGQIANKIRKIQSRVVEI